MFDIIGKRRWFFIIALVVLLACVISLFTVGLAPGVEFSSGTMMTVSFDEDVEKAELLDTLSDLGYPGAIVQRVGEEDFLIRLPELDSASKNNLEAGLVGALGEMEVKEFDSVSPMVAAETTRDAAIAVAVACIGILLYIAWAFRKMPNPFRYGICAIVALVHDARWRWVYIPSWAE
jgi:preprotein translocase subunit SecF